MAFITKSDDTKCYSCGKQCINVEFCSEGSEYTPGLSISRNIRVSITANPEFWGFGGVLISGWATYTNGYYDFFDGYEENHQGYKTCDGTTYGPFSNEQRPDVFFRSVYDPDTGTTIHYKQDGSLDTTNPQLYAERGGAEVYLIDRPKGLIKNVTSDKSSCDGLDPTQVFKKFPENFGWGNKINFNTKVYKNLSGAWRLTSLENCYPSGRIYKPPGYLIDCSGEEKQNIISEYRRYQDYEPTRPRASGESSYYNYSSGCHPDGSVAGKYAGYFTESNSIFRNSDFIEAHLSYDGNAASGLHGGMTIGIKTETSGNTFNNIYTIFDVDHSAGSYTSVKFVGTSSGNPPLTQSMPTGVFNLDIGESGHWIAFNTYDPQTCCGLAAYGVSDEHKKITGDRNYHTDFRKVFNNPKNLRQSNRFRGNRKTYDLFDDTNTVLSYVGDDYYDNFLLPSGDDVSFYYYIGQDWINRKDWRYPSVSGVEISGQTYGYPLLYDSDNIANNTDIFVATGDALMSGYPVFQRDLSYYGNFFETDFYDNVLRIEQQINRGKSDNATCYSKHATLEIFPDCITQYDKLTKNCDEETDVYFTNKLPRLAFVYRGCDFNDDCSFDSSGLPLGEWENQGSVPTGIEDLKRQLAGQELHMFLNLSSAWGGRKPGVPCTCNCPPDEPSDTYSDPEHVIINSPLTFPSFPNFDLNPSGYGCYDIRYQNQKAISLEGASFDNCDEYCDIPNSSVYACLPRQPYTTYGYIMNLCGKATRDRKDVITKAFAKLHQEKTYTNIQYTGEIDEPMYWEVEAPNPLPFTGGGIWGSGTTDRDDTGGVGNGFVQIGGSGYGYWGLADSNKQVVAPYFCTESGSFRCKCDEPNTFRGFVNFSTSGTWQNVLNTHNGWPTDKVPFLIEIEVDDSCVGCTTPVMKNQNLNIEISGLNTEFIHDEVFRYGHNYCQYSQNKFDSDSVLAQMDKPDFSCTTGWDLASCNDSELKKMYSSHYTGNTCNCADGFNTTLYPVLIEKTDIVAGYTSNPGGGASGLIEITDCENSGSSLYDVGYGITFGGGYRVFAEFSLACQGNRRYLLNATCPNIKYEGDIISNLWGNPNGCVHNYPAKVGDNLDLITDLYFIPDANVSIFRKLTDKGLHDIDWNGYMISPQDFYANGIFGVCSGDTVYGYGCYISDPAPGSSPGFVGCISVNACDGKTPCNTCPTGNNPGDVICECGSAIGWDGQAPRVLPAEYTINNCHCDCATPVLAAIYTATPGGLILTSGDACRSIYWYGTDNIPPTLTVAGPPNPYIGAKIQNISSEDFFNWSHGVNAMVTGVEYELYNPILAEETTTGSSCSQLSVDLGFSDRVIDCENTGCLQDNNVNSTTCGEPIYFSGVAENFDGISIRKKKCNPEVAIVTKIECESQNRYKLHISREYHEHNRTWLEKITVGEGENTQDICVPVNVGAYQYNDGNTSGCYTMNYALLSDTVSPVTNPPCSIHPSSGLYVNQDYQYIDPNFPSGSLIWNYFNLFYSQNYLPTVDNGTLVPSVGRDENGSPLCTGTPLDIQNTGTILIESDYEQPAGYNGIFATTGMHSCVQDSVVCGGDLWCNKMFFPRHSYKQNTRIAPFGSPSICTSNNEFDAGIGIGYRENGAYIGGAESLLNEQKLRFIDFCNDNLIQLAKEDIDIDDSTIIVENYLPLIGVVHPGWRYTSDTKSCTIASTGCDAGLALSVHSDLTISYGLYAPKTFSQNNFDSMGYYLDASGVSYSTGGFIAASGVDQCLFNPFKILIDVECNTNRIARKKFSSDEPTFLQGVQSWPSETCKGTFGSVTCGCSSTKCNYNVAPKKGTCEQFVQVGYKAQASTQTLPFCDDPYCSGCTFVCGDDQAGNYLDVDTIQTVSEWWHPSLFESHDLDGQTAYFDKCCEPGQIKHARSLADAWVKNTCDGNYYIISTSGYSNLWQCKTNQYLNPHPGETVGLSECNVCGDVDNSLCGATVSCTGFNTCGCNPIIANISPQLGEYDPPGEPSGVMADCGCVGLPISDSPCPTDSLVKWTITES